MIDVFNIPNTDTNIQVFYPIGTSVWQNWSKPKNCKFIQIFTVGGGGGGGGGRGSNANAAVGGGGGGASSVTTGFFRQIYYLIIYIFL